MCSLCKRTYHYKIIFIKGHRDFETKLKNLVRDAKVRIKSRPVSGGGFGPDIDFISGPDINFKVDISVKGFLG